jgi:PAS domain S-box-containing protein
MHPSEDPAIAQLESALRSSEERFRLIAENASDMIGLLDPAGRRVYVNPAYERMLGDSRELIGRETFADMHPDDRSRMQRHFADLVRDGSGPAAEFRLVARSGEVRYVESNASTIRERSGRVRLVIAVARDVTERRVAEEALRAREAQLRAAQVIANIGSWEWDLARQTLVWSDHMYRICGVDRAAVQPSPELFFGLVHPDDRQRVMDAAQRQSETGASYEEPFRIVHPDGAVRWFQGRGHAELDAAGRPMRIVGICQDITERYQTELELRARDLQRETAHALANLGSWEIDLRTGDRAWSEQLYRIFGLERAEVQPSEEAFLACLHPEDRPRLAATSGRKRDGLDVSERPFRIVRADGAVRVCRSRAQVQRDAAGNPVRMVGFLQDVTERTEADEALRRYAEQLLVTSRRVVDVQEAERRQLASELHDRVGPNLTALGINLRLVEESLPAEMRRLVAGTLRDSARLVEETVAVTRDVMAELRPQSLDDYGLVAALRSLAAAFTKRTGVPAGIRAADVPGRTARAADLALFRIAQEALNNVAKHAGAARVEIRYAETKATTSLEIEDDGCGLDLAQLQHEAGWGLMIMRERAASIGATFDIDSGTGRGVRLRVKLG